MFNFRCLSTTFLQTMRSCCLARTSSVLPKPLPRWSWHLFGHHGRTKMKMIVRLLLGWVMIVNLFPVSPPTLPHFPYLYFLMEIFVNQWHFCLANISTHKWPKVWPQYDHLHSSLHLYFSEGNRHETERNQGWRGEEIVLRTKSILPTPNNQDLGLKHFQILPEVLKIPIRFGLPYNNLISLYV